MGQPLRIITVVNGRELKGPEAERVRIEASYSIRAGNIIDSQAWAEQREKHRPLEVDDRCSVKRAMTAVEARLVEALWTLARLPVGASGGTCGIAYIHDAKERWANAIDRGWDAPPMRPPSPSGRAIDAMHEPLEWLRFLSKDQAALVRSAADSKRGDVNNNVAWAKVRRILPWAENLSVRTLQRRYENGVRSIAAELSIQGFKDDAAAA